MGCGIFRIEKRKAGDVGGIEAENNRTEKINLPKSSIDWSRTKDNERVIFSPDFEKSIEDELQRHGIDKIRTNAVVALDAIYTASPGFFKEADRGTQDKYFRDCIDFHDRHFGHIINAVIHRDEETPHLHVVSVPIIDRGGAGCALCAKELLGGKADFHMMQDAFFAEVSSGYGLERGEIREDGARREHLDTLDYKKMQREIEIERQEEIIEIKRAEISEAEQVKERIEDEIGKLDAIREAVRPLPLSVTQLFKHIGSAVSFAVDNLFRKIERMETLFVSDIRAAFCRMREAGSRFFTPEGIGGKIIYCTGMIPLYERHQGGYRPAAIEDISGEIRTDVDAVDWREAFPAYERVDISPALDQERDIIERIVKIRDIACGRPQEIETLSDVDDVESPGDWDGWFDDPDQEDGYQWTDIDGQAIL